MGHRSRRSGGVRSASRGGRAGIAASVAVCVVVLAGCSGGSADEVGGDPRVVAIRDQATSDFEREVFADGVITDQEYQEARVLQKDCMEPLGYKVTLNDGPGAMDVDSLTPEANQALDSTMMACGEGTTALIEGTYVDVLENPGNDDIFQLKVDCLVRNGVFPEGYSRDDFAKGVGFVEAQSVAFDGCMLDYRSYVATAEDLVATPAGS